MSMTGKLAVLILTCAVLASALGITAYQYSELNEKYAQAQSEYNTLQSEHELLLSNYNALESKHQTLNDTYHTLLDDYSQLNQRNQILIIEYNELNSSYQILALNYTALSANYTTLEQNYDILSNNYTVLSNQYASLFNNYNILSEAFNQPLPYENTPSTSQLELWLTDDKTNEIQYTDPNFICGDFSAMLSLHAKTSHWDMGMVGVFGYTETHDPFDHAFNAILATEGLVYVEPQTDDVWWYQNHESMSEGLWWEYPGTGYVYIEQYIIILSYD